MQQSPAAGQGVLGGATVGFWVSSAGGSPAWPPSCSACASGCAAAATGVSSFPSGSGGAGFILSRSPRASAVDLLSSRVALSAPARDKAKRSSFCCLMAARRIPKSHKDSRTHQFFNCWCHRRGSNPIQTPSRTRRCSQGVDLCGGRSVGQFPASLDEGKRGGYIPISAGGRWLSAGLSAGTARDLRALQALTISCIWRKPATASTSSTLSGFRVSLAVYMNSKTWPRPAREATQAEISSRPSATQF